MFSVKLETSELINDIFDTISIITMNKEISETPDIIVRDIPLSIHRVLVDEQAKKKKSQGSSRFSLSNTIKEIIKEWVDKCRDKK